MQQEKLKIIATLLANAETNLAQAREIFRETFDDGTGSLLIKDKGSLHITNGFISSTGDGKVIEGVFDGENMLGPDTKKYSVPPNYASKSKLVYGDKLKLIITDEGKFTFKQIGPVERSYTTGILIRDNNQFRVAVGEKLYKVLPASVSYYRAEIGDQLAVIVPSDIESEWATIENIIPRDISLSPSVHDTKDDSSPFELPKTLFKRKADDE